MGLALSVCCAFSYADRVDDYITTLSNKGREAYELKHYDEAIGYLERIPLERRSELDQSRLAWSNYFFYAPEKAVQEFRRLLQDNPDSVDALCGAGWSLHDMGDKEQGAILFSKALGIAPNYAPAIEGYTACTGESIQARRSSGTVSYYTTLLAYSGDTPRTHGYVHDLELLYARAGLGYLNLVLTYADIGSDLNTASFRQTEIRPGAGFYAGGTLWRGTVGFLSYDDTAGGRDSAWLAGVGAEYLQWRVNPFADLYAYTSPDAEAWQAVPGLAYAVGPVELRSSLEAGHYRLSGRNDQAGVYVQQTARWSPFADHSLYAGIGGGTSYYGLRGPGSVFYGLPDKRLADAWVQWIWYSNPWNFSAGLSGSRFEGRGGGRYTSFGATLSVGWAWGRLPGVGM